LATLTDDVEGSLQVDPDHRHGTERTRDVLD
jgi:hypothetical protein